MTTALVTGAPGWLGSRMVEVLVRGLDEVPGLEAPVVPNRNVRCLVFPGSDVQSVGAVSDRVSTHEGDLGTGAGLEAFMEGAEGGTVFHIAGVVHPTHGVKEFEAVNAEGTRRLLALAKARGVRRFIYVSSNSPIGTNPRVDDVFDETAPFDPYMGYGRSKMHAEQAVAEGAAQGLDTVVIRPPWFYGPRQPARQNLFFTMIRTGKAPLVGGGVNRRSMAYIDNICQGLALCEKVPEARGQTYWIADERPYAMTEIIDTIERLLEQEFKLACTHKRLRLPNLASDTAFVIDKALQSVGLYHQKIHVLSEMNKTIACTVDKAKRELGYRPQVALEEGMRRSIRWVLDNGGKI